MKLVQDLPEIFEEFGEQRRRSFLEVKEYKEKGIPVVGMYCAYFPTELALAIGAIPVGLCSFANETVPAAERKLPKSMCPLVKSSYGFAVEDKCPFFHFADLVIGETTCDGKKKMYEMMAEFKPVFVMELPNSQSQKSMEFWKQEIIRTKEYLEEFFQVIITDEKMKAAIHLGNRIRKSLLRLCEVMKLEPAPVLGGDIQKIVSGSKYRFDFETTPEVVDQITDQILEEYYQGTMLEPRPRILITGCPIGGDSLKVIRAIEDHGGVVVALENCSGVKTLDRMIDEEDPDIYGAIARRYLSTGCSIMTPNDNRIELIGRIIDEYHVDGVVEMILTGCHATGAESAYINQFVTEEKNIPYMAIDTDYSKSDEGQIITRMSAFMELIADQKAGDARIDINYCYKLIFPGFSEDGENWEKDLNRLFEYTRMPVKILDHKGQTVASIGLEEGKKNPEYWTEYELPEKSGPCVVFYQEKCLKEKAGQVAKIISDYCAMKKLFLIPSNREASDYMMEKPDFMWVIFYGEDDLDVLEKELQDHYSIIESHRQDNKAVYLLSEIEGKGDRDRFIQDYRNIFARLNTDTKLMVGNGFVSLFQKEENMEMIQTTLKIGEEFSPEKNIYLIEEYYQELSVYYMAQEIDEMDDRIEELEVIKEEDRKKNSNLYETLYYYLFFKQNSMYAAARLRIHRNTLLHRVAQINELIHLDDMECLKRQRILMVMQLERIKAKKRKKL